MLIGNLFQLHEDSHDRRGRAGGRHLIIIISLFMTSEIMFYIIVDGSKSCHINVRSIIVNKMVIHLFLVYGAETSMSLTTALAVVK